ncbi:1-acyl-sn-glycerol-3-phosphate acyltransferase [Flavobacterium sp. NRK F10]|uniref:1-acyl-sn-glycerol-3-phosphate acyltransferase n=1 Tax=Flavobacterium sediminis TaxID=2201181 RepID=A0A2U8QU37_9FLAO|nr:MULTISPECIES: lysophospholipid acyltransferase family protein [Flavobacterium]AWM13710.1 1-acyl-sn-glycerol-3-phosphate acyltransferase [Flavobacterium sediminis]MCO6174844.1 1-acyl-sn-glycerol-3-phosphate acyltransferase [Flavobacterium sp. NRK F10]
MKILQYIFWFFWRIWFYILVMIPILVLSPVLLVLVSSESTYKLFFRVARFWAKFVLWGMGFYHKIKWEAPLEKEKSYMLVANHTSMTDIMLMLIVVKNNPFVFVGKKELSKFPIFGFFYKRVCIMVDRSSSKSRYQVFERAQKRLHQGLSICIFPEGGVPDDESIILDEFKDGAFRLAIEHQIPVVPMSFIDNKRRFPFRFFSGKPGRMRVTVHKPIETTGMTLDHKSHLKKEVREIVLKDLKH